MKEESIPLEQKAMLCHVVIHFYSFFKYDHDASDAAADTMKADKDSGRYNKSLIERQGIRYLRKISTSIRRYHRSNTLPWGEQDARILPSQHYMEYMKGLRTLIAEYDKNVEAFCKSLPALYTKAKSRLGKMYKPDEYPDIADVRKRYYAEVQISPVPVANDFRVVKLDKKELETIKKNIEEEKSKAAEEALKHLWERLQTPIKKMVEKLSDKDGEFRDSLVNNITSIVELIPKLNFGDAKLNEFANDVKKKLCVVDPQELRKDEKVRKDTAKKAKEILDKISAYC